MRMRIVVLVLAAIIIGSSCKKSKPAPASGLNPWDGKYRIEGSMVDSKDPSFTWAGDTYLYDMKTLSSTQIEVISKDLGISGHLIRNGINLSYYSKFGLIVTFNPANNKITSITNSYGQPSESGRSAVLDPSGVNTWDPATKNIKIKFWMDETGFPGHRTAFDETWVYIGAR